MMDIMYTSPSNKKLREIKINYNNELNKIEPEYFEEEDKKAGEI